ncbi:excalibur calcium-binding domain-containing protein [Notoacmeibacter ruber]|uniref:Excalibur calcium-binding domain-containing protein n=1 Tax=Notoacmeibacter ruber TaxID=2670375 RepID=A0A3L7JCV3_9HYPH|nr:excalibur calcium-binding domain-containing protein [Notoacmeibacter ruber]RLQ88300.1 hypothetical protein D8780_08870 [Notoacmeibacter ruber]
MKALVHAVILATSLSVVSIDMAFAARCADYSNCREAVIAWCAGMHPRADGDNDGIPCENVCKSRVQVVAIMAEIGCTR